MSMVQANSNTDVVSTDTGAGGGGVSLGKGAWDCDRNVEIPPEAEVLMPMPIGQSFANCVALHRST